MVIGYIARYNMLCNTYTFDYQYEVVAYLTSLYFEIITKRNVLHYVKQSYMHITVNFLRQTYYRQLEIVSITYLLMHMH